MLCVEVERSCLEMCMRESRSDHDPWRSQAKPHYTVTGCIRYHCFRWSLQDAHEPILENTFSIAACYYSEKKEPMLRSCLFRVVSCGADGSATSTMVHGRFIPSFPIGPTNAETICLQQSHYRGRHLSGPRLCKWGSKLEQNHTRYDAQ
jgi:hypothetical protein